MHNGKRRMSLTLFVLVVLALSAFIATGVRAQEGAVDPAATEILKQMTDYLGGLKKFSVQTENSLEVILRSGQKIQYNNPASLLVQRPDKLVASRDGDIFNQELYYDGKTLTIYDVYSKYYATVETPGTIDEALDFARNNLDLYAPGSDLIYADAYNILTEDMVSGLYVGESVVDGTKCHHLAFRNNEVDWQIWIEIGDKPLPRKFIVTSKWMTGAPQFTVITRNWDLSPKISDNAFTFMPPEDARQIDFISLPGSGTSER
jgi:hypothetical protein